MKKLIVCAALFFSVVAYADDECPSAADAAEAQNPEKYKNCDYTHEGLNGILHRAWQNSSDKSDEKKSQEKSDAKSEINSAAEKDLLVASEFSTAQQLQNLRFALVQKASLECAKGFVVDGERYLPKSQKTKVLELIYHCL